MASCRWHMKRLPRAFPCPSHPSHLQYNCASAYTQFTAQESHSLQYMDMGMDMDPEKGHAGFTHALTHTHTPIHTSAHNTHAREHHAFRVRSALFDQPPRHSHRRRSHHTWRGSVWRTACTAAVATAQWAHASQRAGGGQHVDRSTDGIICPHVCAVAGV